MVDNNIIFFCGFALAIAITIVRAQWRRLQVKQTPSRETSEKKASPTATPDDRPYGVWDPVAFNYPTVTPWTSFDVEKTKPIPFRPFRWGPTYPINMGIRSMPWDDWIQLDNHYRKTHAIRLQRTTDQKELATTTLPGFHAHALECLCEIASFMAARYSHVIELTRAIYVANDPKTHGDSLVGPEAGAVVTITNKVTGEFFDLVKIEQEEGPEWNPMKVAGLLMQDDLAVMVEGTDGQYFFQAGSICTAGFWRLQDKIGTSLEDIHSRGAVPGWRDKLKFSMERFFQKMKEDKPIQRNNYFFQIDNGLAWSQNTNGPEKIFDQTNKGPIPELLAKSEDPSWKAPAPTLDPMDVYFRTERQSLRRMPKTGCILFTIRTYFHKVSEFADEPGVPGRMASAIRSWPDDVAKYKGSDLYTPVLLPYLDDLHAKQLVDGRADPSHGEGAGSLEYPF